jgi:hypothetical protein
MITADLAILETSRREGENWGGEPWNNANIVVKGVGGLISVFDRVI